jgi:hypothetical protein
MLRSSDEFIAYFQLVVSLVCGLAVCLGALYYFRRVRLERPAIGTFNGRDITILFAFLVLLPALYLVIPRWVLTIFLILTFVSALAIGYRPVLSPLALWLGIGVLVGADLYMGQRMIDTAVNWSFVWLQNSVVVGLAAVAIANLYVQGGMQLKHVAVFASVLGLYDWVFALTSDVTSLLIRAFVNYPLFPAMGFRITYDEAVLGLGDLLVFSVFTLAAYKGYGRVGLRLALSLVVLVGAVVSSLSGLFFNYIDMNFDILIPVQTWFGPAALLGYLWLRWRYGRERTMQEYMAGVEVRRRVTTRTSQEPATSTATLRFAVAVEDRPALDELVQYFGNGSRSAYLHATLKVMQGVKLAEQANGNGHSPVAAKELTINDAADATSTVLKGRS